MTYYYNKGEKKKQGYKIVRKNIEAASQASKKKEREKANTRADWHY